MLCKAEQSKPAVTQASMFRPFLVATVFTSILFATSPARAQLFDPCLDPESWCSELGALFLLQLGECEDALDAGCDDSDADGLPDGVELAIGTDPGASDSDSDGLSDGVELLLTGTDPTIADTDGDGVSDGADPMPGGTTGPFEDRMRTVAASISTQPLSCFKGGNNTARENRRTNLAASINMAADMAQAGKADAAKGILSGALAPVDILVICPVVRDSITAKLTGFVNILDGLTHP